MTETCYEEIIKRLEVREFSDRPVTDEIILKVIKAGRSAPSAYNRQPWNFVVIKDKNRLNELGKLCTSGPYVKDAAFAVAVFVDPQNPFYIIDGTRATQTMMLAGWALGLGSCWVTGIEREEAKEFLKAPKDLYLLAVIPFGYPKRAFKGKKARKPLSSIVFLEEFGNPLK